MKTKLLLLLGLLTSLSCSNQAQGIYIDKFFPLTAEKAGICLLKLAEENAFTKNGMLDVAAGSPQFFIGVRINGGENVEQRGLVVGSTVLERENRDRPVITQQVVSYRLSRRLGPAPKQYLTNLTGSFTNAGLLDMSIQLISPDLGEQLRDGLTPSTDPNGAVEDFVDVLADVEFKGEFSNSKNRFTTGVLTYPIRAFRSNPMSCNFGFVRFYEWPDPPRNDSDWVGLDLCRYVGQMTSQLIVPPPPSCCPMVGTFGC